MADVILEVTVPEAYITKAVDSFNAVAGLRMSIEADGNDFRGRWDFTIPEKEVSETMKDFGERFIRSLGKAVIDLVDRAEDEERYRTEISAITPPVSDVPEDILI